MAHRFTLLGVEPCVSLKLVPCSWLRSPSLLELLLNAFALFVCEVAFGCAWHAKLQVMWRLHHRMRSCCAHGFAGCCGLELKGLIWCGVPSVAPCLMVGCMAYKLIVFPLRS
eukprot:1267678-Amphidinium_carterae.1